MRGWVQTICMVICAILCLFLIQHMVLYTNVPMHMPNTTVQRAGRVDTEQSIEVKLDSGALTTLVNRQLPVDFALQEISLQITEQDNLRCMAQIKPSQLSLPRAAQALLPESCPLYALISVGYAEQMVVLHPVSLQIGGLKLPHALLNPFTQELGEAITNGMQAQGIQVRGVKVSGQHMYIGMEPIERKNEQIR